MDGQVAFDLVGETFAVAFEQRAKMRGTIDKVGRSWIFGIGNNLLNDFFRSGQIERRAMQRLGLSPILVPDDQMERIDQLAGTARLREAVSIALNGLPEKYREAVQLRVVKELPYEAIASSLCVSEEVARARVSRGLRQLRELVNENENDEVMEHA